MDIWKIVQVVLAILPFVGMALLTHKVNLHKSNRAFQVLMPLVALIYCIVAVCLLDKISEWILKLWEMLVNLVSQWLPSLESTLTGINIVPFLIYIANTLLIVVFLLLKSFLLPILKGLWSKLPKLAKYTCGWFYDYEEDIDKWVVQKPMAQVKKYFAGFYWAMFCVSGLVFAMSQILTDEPAFQVPFYPVFGVLVLGEVLFFLSGLTKAEFVEDFLGEDEDSYKVANYGLLRNALRDLFGDRVLYESTLDTGGDGGEEGYDRLEELLQDEDAFRQAIGSYFSACRQRGEQVDANYINSCLGLLDGQSTLICNPFYRDLTDYLMFPVLWQLMSYRKCLVVVGRESAEEDVKRWIDDGIFQSVNTRSLWKSAILSEEPTNTDVGILRFSDIYNLKLQNANKEFFSRVGFVLLIEPSRILATGQVGVSLLVSRCEAEGKKVVYAACDRNCDGLVDALSHTLRTSITEVTATLAGGANSSQMYWNADGGSMHHKIFPGIARYLGMGTEIASVAMKHQISKIGWLSCGKFPVLDMKWIAGQYYKTIAPYANIPVSQEALDRAFAVDSNLWDCPREKNSFLVVEDEFCNLFEMTRVFATRAMEQGFVNVISEDYLLRDYMLDNVSVFLSDPKAIPTIVADFVRSERNTVLKLLMMMANGPVREDVVEREFQLCGIECENVYATLQNLISRYCCVDEVVLAVHFREEMQEDALTSVTVRYYEVDETSNLSRLVQSLKNAYYIAEDEQDDLHHIGARLYGHVFQMLLPGQFVTVGGKYYQVQTITPQNGVVVRRAADHITERRYYRQLRHIRMENWTPDPAMGSSRTVSDMEITRGFCDLQVSTEGYMELESTGDLKGARRVSINNIPVRSYHNKSVLRVRLPGSSDKVRYTICLLLNEIFRTTYPESYHYVSAVMPGIDAANAPLRGVLHTLEGVEADDCIYIIEDSDIDLGLTASVDRNLKRYFETVWDVLAWHTAKMAEVPAEEPKEFVPEFPVPPPEGPKGLKKVWKKIKDFFGRIFKKKKPAEVPVEPETPVPETEPAEVPAEPETPEQPPVEAEPSASDDVGEPVNVSRSVNPMFFSVDTESPATEPVDDITGEDEELVWTTEPRKTPYQQKNYLMFGYGTIDESLDFQGTMEYLAGYGYDRNPLQKVREGGLPEEDFVNSYDPSKVHLCDFCGCELLGGEYEVLKDGRERCGHCSRTAIKTAEQFREVFKNVRRNMETFYGIKLNVAIKVRTTNSQTIAKECGTQFVPTPGYDGRVLGFAKKDRTGYSIYVENGSPKLAAIATIAHELTHIWQYLNWNAAGIREKYGKQNELLVYEGMAKWAEIQYLLLLGETARGRREEVITRHRQDEYGIGFNIYTQKYPLAYTGDPKETPFRNNPPL